MKLIGWLVVAAVAFNMACGYRLSGSGKNLPPAASTIAIPDFKNNTLRFQAEQYITQAIRDEMIRRSHLKLTKDVTQADLVLEGKIQSFETLPLSYSDRAAANLYEVRISVDIRLIDQKKSELVFEGNNINFRSSYQTDQADFFSQETEALSLIAEKFASTIVSSILENF
jgi:outer membrane lipopolysaccharide assembly protein LptE/RlpB